jgi:oxalate decarboxylase
MFEANRRIILQSIAVGAGTVAASQSFAVGNDGHAAGYDISAASEYLPGFSRRLEHIARPNWSV